MYLFQNTFEVDNIKWSYSIFSKWHFSSGPTPLFQRKHTIKPIWMLFFSVLPSLLKVFKKMSSFFHLHLFKLVDRFIQSDLQITFVQF